MHLMSAILLTTTFLPIWTQSNYCIRNDGICYFTNFKVTDINTQMVHIKNVEFRNSNMPNFTLDFVLYFPNLIRLLANNCSIVEIDSHIFEVLQNIQQLNFSSNHIQALKGGTFINTGSLKSLDLSYNIIRSIEANAFQGLATVIKLSLAHNEIEELDRRLFNRLSGLKHLKLGNNHIQRINLDIFMDLHLILDLSHNRIEHIESNEKVSVIDLNLSHNRIKELNIFPNLKSLDTLDVSYNHDLTLLSTTFIDIGNTLHTLNMDGMNLQRLQLDSVLAPLVKLRNLHASLERLYLNRLPYLPDLEVVSVKDISADLGQHILSHNLTLHFPKLRNVIVSNDGWNCNNLVMIILRLERFNITVWPNQPTNRNPDQQHDEFNGIRCEKVPQNSKNVYKMWFWILLPLTLAIGGFTLWKYVIDNGRQGDPYVSEDSDLWADTMTVKYCDGRDDFSYVPGKQDETKSDTFYAVPFEETLTRCEEIPINDVNQVPAYCQM